MSGSDAGISGACRKPTRGARNPSHRGRNAGLLCNSVSPSLVKHLNIIFILVLAPQVSSSLSCAPVFLLTPFCLCPANMSSVDASEAAPKQPEIPNLKLNDGNEIPLVRNDP